MNRILAVGGLLLVLAGVGFFVAAYRPEMSPEASAVRVLEPEVEATAVAGGRDAFAIRIANDGRQPAVIRGGSGG